MNFSQTCFVIINQVVRFFHKQFLLNLLSIRYNVVMWRSTDQPFTDVQRIKSSRKVKHRMADLQSYFQNRNLDNQLDMTVDFEKSIRSISFAIRLGRYRKL